MDSYEINADYGRNAGEAKRDFSEREVLYLSMRQGHVSRQLKQVFNGKSRFIETDMVYDLNVSALPVRRHRDGGYYLCGSRLPGEAHDAHEFYKEVPEGMYVRTIVLEMRPVADLPDLIICVTDYDFASLISVSCAVKELRLDPKDVLCMIPGKYFSDDIEAVRRYLSGDLEKKDIPIPRLDVIFGQALESAVSCSPCGISGNIRTLLFEGRFSGAADFGSYFGVPEEDVQDWFDDPSLLPEWTYRLFEDRLLRDGRI